MVSGILILVGASFLLFILTIVVAEIDEAEAKKKRSKKRRK
jgi:hypothetical protein